MYNLYTIDITGGKFIKCYHILWIMILDFKQICNFAIGFLRQISAYLNVDALIPPYCNKTK
jgi:hypothetical protein